MKRIILLIFSFINCNISMASKPLFVILHYEMTSFFKDSFFLQITQPINTKGFNELLYSHKILSFTKTGKTCTSITQYDIEDTSCALFMLGFGHEMIIMPGDTMEITINPKPSEKINDIYPSPWMNEFWYSGKNRFIHSLFDSIAYICGELKWSGTRFSDAGSNLDSFYRIVTSDYNKRLDYLKNYTYRHHIPDIVYQLAEAEISAAYFNNLVNPIGTNVSKSLLPIYYDETLKSVNFNDEKKFFKTLLFQPAAYNSAFFHFLTDKLEQIITDKGLVDIYNYIKHNYTDNIRDDLLTDHLNYFIGSPYDFPSYDSLVTDFKTICKNEKYTYFIDDLVTKKKKEIIRKISLEDAMSSTIVDTAGHKFLLKSIFKGKPVVIDCWASWCIPCLKEMPSSKILEKKYNSKVDFVYLSFDRNRLKWKEKINSLDLGRNSLLLQGNFTADFSRWLLITSIPRYVVFDKNGNLITGNALHPSNPNFSETLDNLVKEK
ncbi:MAG: hypothetical protein B6D37_10855 [Sphingobacteriales bacterium UTBCD1]|nr:MAG: hypothetical protein B6D37_10855 [Sphingobacteriales bacterium UTBCD1]